MSIKEILLTGCLPLLMLLPSVALAEEDNGDELPIDWSQAETIEVTGGISCEDGFVARGNECEPEQLEPPAPPAPPPPPPGGDGPSGGGGGPGGGDNDDDDDGRPAGCPQFAEAIDDEDECRRCNGRWADRNEEVCAAGVGATIVGGGTAGAELGFGVGGHGAIVGGLIGMGAGVVTSIYGCSNVCKPLTPLP